MSYASTNQATGPRARRFVPAVLALVAACVALCAMSATAKAEPVGYEFDNSVINLGGPSGTWAKLIDPSIPDPKATLITDVAADGSLTATAGDFVFPTKRIENLPTDFFLVDATVQIGAEGPITGTFDKASGASTLVIPANVLITVYQDGGTDPIGICRVNGFNLDLSTSAPNLSDPGDPTAEPPRPAAEYPASAFAAPAGAGEGAVVASWASLPPSKGEGGSLDNVACPALDGMLGGQGGVWLEGIAGTDVSPSGIALPTVAPKLTQTPASQTASKDASFTFTKGDGETSPVSGFTCSLDGGAFEPCDSGSKTYGDLANGSHKFEVKAKNAKGEGPAASYSWTVGGGKAKLGALKVTPKSKSVKRGKKATFTAKIKNAGAAAAKGAKVCVKAPGYIKVKKCVTLGSVAAGKTATAKFKVTVSKGAKRGKKATLKFTATANGAAKKTASASVKVK